MSTTLVQAQALVDGLSALVANYVKQECSVANRVYMEHQTTVTADAGTTTLVGRGDSTGQLVTATVNNQTSAGATVNVAAMLASAGFLQAFARGAARVMARQLDASVLGNYAGFTGHAPVGTAATDLTDVVISKAALDLTALACRDESLYLAIDTNETTSLKAITQFANLLDVAKLGNLALSNLVNGKPAIYRGLTLLPTNQCTKVSTTMHNLAFTDKSLATVTSGWTLTNDATHVQSMSVSSASEIGVFVGLAFDGSDTQVVTIRTRAGSAILRAASGIDVRS